MGNQLLQLKPIVRPLEEWYRENARSLPWRKDNLPYHVWVSEIMLQQTRVAAVVNYYERFMQELPDIYSLAQVSEERLLKLWQGLGYYSRAIHLQKAAQIIVEQYNGVFPATYEEILDLPGIGEYTAGAIASICFGIPKASVDGNVLRIIARLLFDNRDIRNSEVKKEYKLLVENILPQDDPGRLNQALMEFGEQICVPKGKASCETCPLADHCLSHHEGKVDRIPVRSAMKQRRIELRKVFLLFYKDRVALRKRDKSGLLANLWEFPNVLAEDDTFLTDHGIDSLEIIDAGEGKHVFSHVEWHMTAFAVELLRDNLRPTDCVWVSINELESRYAVPTAFRFVMKYVRSRLRDREW